jgi:hypothetical protein
MRFSIISPFPLSVSFHVIFLQKAGGAQKYYFHCGPPPPPLIPPFDVGPKDAMPPALNGGGRERNGLSIALPFANNRIVHVAIKSAFSPLISIFLLTPEAIIRLMGSFFYKGARHRQRPNASRVRIQRFAYTYT